MSGKCPLEGGLGCHFSVLAACFKKSRLLSLAPLPHTHTIPHKGEAGEKQLTH